MSQWQFSLPPSQSVRYQALDVNDNPELCDHTEVELPLIGWHQMKTDTLGASLYCILLVTYAVMVIVSWLPVPIHLAEPALFSACNLVLLVSTGLLQRHLSAQLKRAQRQVFKSACNNSLSFWFCHHEAFSTEELLNWCTGLMVTGLSQVQCTLGVDYLSAIQDSCLWYK
jgi:hypothetical protein